MKHILIADDHEVTRRGIREIVRDAFPDATIAEASNAAAVHAQISAHPCDLLLLDIVMPGPSVLETLSKIRATHPALPVLVLTAAIELEYIVQTMKAGANGFIHKHRASDDLLAAIREVASGGTYLHSESAIAVAMSLRAVKPALPHTRLSERELEIFKCIARGRAVKEVAGDLGISDKTVATYLARIREKTGLTSHVEIARYALQNGLVD